MSTQAPEVKTNPGDAMAGFIGSLKEAGMAEAAIAPPPEKQPEAAPDANKPPEKAPEKAPEVKPVEQPKAPETEEDKWPRSAKDWDAFKAKRKERETALQTERDAIKAERDKLNSEIETLKKSGPSPELDGLKKERDQLSEQLRIVSVENHPKFKAHFDGKVNAQLELAKRIVGEERSAKVVEILKRPDGPEKDRQLSEFISDLPGLQQSRIASVLNALTEIQTERQTEIGRAKETFDRMQQEQQDKQKAQVQQYLSMFDGLVKKVQDAKEGNPLFQTKEGDEGWNGEVTKRIESAKALVFGTPDPATAMQHALHAMAYPAVLKQMQGVMQENDKLKAQVAELSKANPTVHGKESERGTETGAAPIQLKPGSSPADALGGWVKTLNQPQQ